MAQSDTVDRILDAAEVLFADRGFSETSLRMITSKAKVNLAAVNYHFGSKNALIHAVFARFLTPYSATLDEVFDDLEAKAEGAVPTLDKLLWALAESAARMPQRNERGISIFMRRWASPTLSPRAICVNSWSRNTAILSGGSCAC